MKKNSMREKFESNKLPKKEISDILNILSDANNKKNINKEYNKNPIAGILFAIIIIIHIVILMININASMWINKLEKIKCACSDSYMRSYIKYFLYILIPISIFNIVMNLYLYFNNMDPSSIYKYFSKTTLLVLNILNVIYVLYALINIVIAIIFINKLKELNCECSEDIRREVYWIYNIVMASLICIMFSIIILSFIFNGIMYVMSSK
jgi:hypothetical protein